MSASFDVLSVGELNPDFILAGLRSDGPVLGTEQTFGKWALVLGSSTAIATVLMARLGLKTALVSRVGDDDHGHFCIEALRRDRVDTTWVALDPEVATGLTVSVSYPKDRLLLTAPGTMAIMSSDEVPRSALASSRHLHVSSYFLQPGLRTGLPALFAEARARGLTTSLDTGFDPDERWMSADLRALLAHVDILLPNEVELRSLTGITDPIDAGRSLLELGVRRVSAKLGSTGGIVIRPDTSVASGSPRVEAIDTTGAGDAFNAGILFGHLRGFDDHASLTLATACGAMTAAAMGGTGGFTSMTEVDVFLAGQPDRA